MYKHENISIIKTKKIIFVDIIFQKIIKNKFLELLKFKNTDHYLQFTIVKYLYQI